MKYPTLRFLFDRKHTATSTNAAPVVAYIYYNKARRFYSTGISLYLNQWHEALHVIKRDDAITLNERLNAIANKFNSFIKTLMVANEAFSFEKYDEYTRINQVLEGSVIDFIEHAIEERKDIRESTRKVHMCLVQALREFKKIQYFSDVTVANIMAFDNWLHARKNYRVVSIFSYHRRFHTYINLAIKLEYLNKDPYFTFRPDKGEKEVIRYIEEADILKLKKLKLDLKYLERTRDLFIFQCYTGLSYSDLALFDYSKVEIEKNSKGKKVYVLRDKRLKTNTNFTIVLMKPAMEILTKYDYKLPIISNQKYNKYLKEIGKMAKFPIELTTHVARHTFATFCINNKVNIEIVSKAMGHSNIATTQIYAKILDKTVQNELSNLDAKLKKSK